MKEIKNIRGYLTLLLVMALILTNVPIVKAATYLPNRICIDTPKNGASITSSSFTISGWALNSSGIKSVNILVDGVNVGKAAIGKYRPDVNKVYPGYTNGSNSGFSFTMSSNALKTGTRTITVEAVGNNGTIAKNAVTINYQALIAKMAIDTPSNKSTVEPKDLSVGGWALNPSGIKAVNILLDGKSIGSANLGFQRNDVNKVYPGYPNGDKSGYNFTISAAKLSTGSRTITVQAVGNNGSVVQQSKVVNVQIASVGSLCIDTPKSGSTINNSDISIVGWAVHSYGIKNINIIAGGKIIGQATMGISRPDVNAIFKSYPGSDKSGFKFTLLKNLIPSGVNKITVQAVANNGAVISSNTSITLIKPQTRICIDTPASNSSIKIGSNVYIAGWALQPSGVKNVDITVNGVKAVDASYGGVRNDVNSAYPGYPNGANSGYSATIPAKYFASGSNIIVVRVHGNDGSLNTVSTTVKYGSKTIVIDPGHNYGGDYGAAKTFNGVKYSETELNMQVAVRLKTVLEGKGYNVVLTRQASERSTIALKDSLAARVNLANSINADLFVSLHHDSSTSSAATGVSTYYSSWRPNIDTSGTYTVNDITYDRTPSLPAQKSALLAKSLVTALAGTGYVNRGVTDRNLYVTRNTNMTSVLIELGFVSNQSEAIKCANGTEQQKKANAIGNAIDQFLKSN